jgi:hypothetical protein
METLRKTMKLSARTGSAEKYKHGISRLKVGLGFSYTRPVVGAFQIKVS